MKNWRKHGTMEKQVIHKAVDNPRELPKFGDHLDQLIKRDAKSCRGKKIEERWDGTTKSFCTAIGLSADHFFSFPKRESDLDLWPDTKNGILSHPSRPSNQGWRRDSAIVLDLVIQDDRDFIRDKTPYLRIEVRRCC